MYLPLVAATLLALLFGVSTPMAKVLVTQVPPPLVSRALDPERILQGQGIVRRKSEGVRVLMLTGDNRTTARATADRLGIDQIQVAVLPEQKSEVLKRLQAEGHIVAMAGDGMHDAAAAMRLNRRRRAPPAARC